jgi:hypothetical protein
MESDGFKSVPLSYQEARIYSFHQTCDKMIGLENVPQHLAVEQVIGQEWVWPNDPRVTLMEREAEPGMSILDSFRIDGQVAVVTGAGKGIGRAIAIALAEAGAGRCAWRAYCGRYRSRRAGNPRAAAAAPLRCRRMRPRWKRWSNLAGARCGGTRFGQHLGEQRGRHSRWQPALSDQDHRGELGRAGRSQPQGRLDGRCRRRQGDGRGGRRNPQHLFARGVPVRRRRMGLTQPPRQA